MCHTKLTHTPRLTRVINLTGVYRATFRWPIQEVGVASSNGCAIIEVMGVIN